MDDNKQAADDMRTPNDEPKRMGAAAGAQYDSDARSTQDVKAQRGGVQEDQLSGETQKGAHNQEMRGENPQGNQPDENRSARQKGDTF
ncbi:MAG TPA: hypothetical protein VM864_03535 [Pyrinomonadaceae bacterium]|jgi:hypothetical protein|nr:hypothetical protein [Pyrinomonadaceae bacterium]